MGTVSYDICESGTFNKNVRGALVVSGAHTTSTTSSSLTDGAAGAGSAVDGKVGCILTIVGDEDMRLKFGGATPTASDGIMIFADTVTYLEIPHPGAINLRDVA